MADPEGLREPEQETPEQKAMSKQLKQMAENIEAEREASEPGSQDNSLEQETPRDKEKRLWAEYGELTKYIHANEGFSSKEEFKRKSSRFAELERELSGRYPDLSSEDLTDIAFEELKKQQNKRNKKK